MRDLDIALRTAEVPSGDFTMGDPQGRPDEQPLHRVYVSRFAIALLPVTNADFRIYLKATSADPPRFWLDPSFNAAQQPVVGVSWFEADAYCAWLTAQSGRRCRLPSEAEREKAARGGADGGRYPWGDDAGAEGGKFEQKAPNPVGQSEPNGYGLFDMGYNIHEWCADWYAANYYGISPSRDPTGPDAGIRRASRGGAWRHQLKISRCAARSSLPPSFQYNDYGFRVVIDIET